MPTLWATQALLALGRGQAVPAPTGPVMSETRYGGRDALAVFSGDEVQHWDRAADEAWRHDLLWDPGETTRLPPDLRLATLLEAHAVKTPAVPPDSQDLDAGEAAALEALGYRDAGP